MGVGVANLDLAKSGGDQQSISYRSFIDTEIQRLREKGENGGKFQV